jgi:hypothetical protein
MLLSAMAWIPLTVPAVVDVILHAIKVKRAIVCSIGCTICVQRAVKLAFIDAIQVKQAVIDAILYAIKGKQALMLPSAVPSMSSEPLSIPMCPTSRQTCLSQCHPSQVSH